MAWNPLAIFARRSTEARTQQSQTLVTRTASAVPVSNETAMKSSAVYAGVRYHAQIIGQLPWYAYQARRSGDGATLLSTAQFDGVNRILNARANAYMSSQRLRELLVTHAILYGNGVAEIERDATGRATALYVLRPDKLSFEFEIDRIRYLYDDDRRGRLVFGPEDVFHVAGYGSKAESPMVGASVIEYAAESIGWHRATELFGAAYFANGIHPSVIITLKNALSPEAYKVFMDTMRRKFSGSEGAHQPFVTDGEMTVEKLSVQPNESQFIESLQHQVDEIARWIGVPPSKIGHLIHAGVRANVEQEAISVIQDHVMPWVRRFELEADAKLFRPNERFFTRMDLSAMLRGDAQSRAEFYAKMLDKGVFSVNEVREMEDMNPLGPEGDQHLVQGQYRPLEQAGIEQAPPMSAPEDQGNTDEQAGSGDAAIEAPRAKSEDEWSGVRRTLRI